MAAQPLIYGALVEWYDLLDPTADHEEEAALYARLLLPDRGAVGSTARPTLLELGAGAGNNAWFLKRDFACTLSDRSAGSCDRNRIRPHPPPWPCAVRP